MGRVLRWGFCFLSFLILLSIVSISSATPEVSVYLDPSSVETSPGSEFTLAVRVSSGPYGVSGGEVNLAFNSDVFETIEVKVGDLFGPEPLVGLGEVNATAGVIRYVVARAGTTIPPTPPGTFISTKFKVLEKANPGTYEVRIVRIGLANEKFEYIPQTEIELKSAEITVKKPYALALPAGLNVILIGLAVVAVVAVILAFIFFRHKPTMKGKFKPAEIEKPEVKGSLLRREKKPYFA